MKKFCIERGIGDNIYFNKCDDEYIDMEMYYDDFEELTGLKLKPGEAVQCELKVIKKG